MQPQDIVFARAGKYAAEILSCTASVITGITEGREQHEDYQTQRLGSRLRYYEDHLRRHTGK